VTNTDVCEIARMTRCLSRIRPLNNVDYTVGRHSPRLRYVIIPQFMTNSAFYCCSHQVVKVPVLLSWMCPWRSYMFS